MTPGTPLRPRQTIDWALGGCHGERDGQLRSTSFNETDALWTSRLANAGQFAPQTGAAGG
jgi:hypothetical protein